jgi:dihydroflavonol-4-reductase
MKILITGATGFIGQHLLEELKDDDVEINIISRKKNPKFWCEHNKLEIFNGDVSQKASMNQSFKNVDVLINLAAELKNNDKYESTNIGGTKNLIALCKENRVKKIIHLSSVGVVGVQYSGRKIIVDENFPCHPQNEYERTKLEAEKIISNSEISFVILRPTNVFGDHHPRNSLLNLFQQLKKEKLFPLQKNASVNYVYAKDVAHAIRFCLLNNVENKIFNIGESMLLLDFLKLCSAEIKASLRTLNMSSVFFGLGEALNYFGIKKIKKKLRVISNRVEYKSEFMNTQIKYKYGIKTGIKNTIAFYKLK